MLVAALIALAGSLAGVMVASPLVALVVSRRDADRSDDEELREMQLVIAVGQLAGIGGAVGWYAGPLAGAAAGLAAAGVAWTLTRTTRVFNNGLLVLVPAALTGALAAAILA